MQSGRGSPMELGGSLIADVAAAPPPRVGLGTSPARGKTIGREQRVPKLGATGPRRHWTEMRSLILRINKEGRRAFEQSEGLQLGNCLGRGLGKVGDASGEGDEAGGA